MFSVNDRSTFALDICQRHREIRDADSSRSRRQAAGLDNFGAERLHPMARNWPADRHSKISAV